MSTLSNDVACIETELHLSRRDNGVLRSAAVELRKKCAEQVRDVAEFAREINMRVGMITALERNVTRMQTIIDRYENQYALLKTRNDDLLVERRKVDRRYEMLKKDQLSIQRCNQRMDDEAGVLEKTIEELRQLADNYEDRNVRLEIDIAKLRGLPPPTEVSAR